MPNDIQTITLTITLDEDASEVEVNRVTSQLYEHLLKSPAQQVELPRQKTTQAGAKGDPITIGSIVLTLGVPAVAGVMTILKICFDQGYFDRGSLKLKLENGREIEYSGSLKSPNVETMIEQLVTALEVADDGGQQTTA